MNPAHSQSTYSLRFDWGLAGARAVAGGALIVAVVDVLSFTTSVSVAVDHDIEVFPYPRRDEWAAELARKHDASLAVGRSLAGPGQVSLSPLSIRTAHALNGHKSKNGEKLVLPSPNGSTIAHELAGTAPVVIAASLRNATAVGSWIGESIRSRPGSVVAVIGSGERWPGGELRPAAEDLWGAGAVIAALPAGLTPSPEAELAAQAWRSVAADPLPALRDCASGRELIATGFADDVEIAGEIDASSDVPLMDRGRFRGVPARERPSGDQRHHESAQCLPSE